jgi:hypothetical protein
VKDESLHSAGGPVPLFLISVRIGPRPRPCWRRLHSYIDRLWLRLRLVWINDWLRLARCVGLRVHNLGTPISNFAVPEFDNPAVLENNGKIRAVPRPTGDKAMRVFELLVWAVASDSVGVAKNSNHLLPRHARFEPRHLLAGCARGEKRDNREGQQDRFHCTPVYQKRRQVGKARFTPRRLSEVPYACASCRPGVSFAKVSRVRAWLPAAVSPGGLSEVPYVRARAVSRGTFEKVSRGRARKLRGCIKKKDCRNESGAFRKVFARARGTSRGLSLKPYARAWHEIRIVSDRP